MTLPSQDRQFTSEVDVYRQALIDLTGYECDDEFEEFDDLLSCLESATRGSERRRCINAVNTQMSAEKLINDLPEETYF